ncbi:efflux RND transporter periplasmic adaptor subunit [uncultured Desulfuromonas sp.]|uniref:efflux RND transporter periplasmic adaptor subunit n=1 Tax=uncultured Desulfuromonas sp. TaxID=181013 RepID=UPI00261816AC|nr:efflux RND transporter periplasmic adaptor subunit [uncultured Desulfuromonas sp.]
MKQETTSGQNGPGTKTGGRSRRTAATVSIWSALTLLCAGAYLLLQPPAFAEGAKEEAPTRPPMPVEVTEVSLAAADRNIGAVGTLHSNESVTIAAEIAGRIAGIDFAEGEGAAEGKSLIRLDASVLEAELDRAEANRALHEANYRRAEALLKDKAISERERDETYALWQLDEASVRLAKAQLDKATIRAPFAGTTGLRRVSVGDYVQPGQPLVNLEDTGRLKVEFRVPEKFSAQVKVGQRLELESDAYPGRDFIGRLYAIDPQVEMNSRSLVLRGQLDNRDGLLRPGQFVKVTLAVEQRTDVLFVPEQALITQPNSQFVYRVDDGTAQMAPVKTGMRRKGWVEVTSGLAAGDVVVTGGHQKIGPGSPVHPVPADPALFAKL